MIRLNGVPRRPVRVVSVHSFRGGTGKSNLSANVAAQLAREGMRVGVIDADVQSPGIHVLFGLSGDDITASLNDFLFDGVPIDQVALDVRFVHGVSLTQPCGGTSGGSPRGTP